MSRLSAVKRGKLDTGFRFCFYGDEGVGKTTLAASAPRPIIFDVEDGSGNLDITRYQFRDDQGGHVPHTFEDIRLGIDDLIRSEHDYQTLVIDSLDRLESLIWKYVLARDSKRKSNVNKKANELKTIEDYGYGKGYVIALDEWRALCRNLDLLRQQGMNIILVGHQQIRTFRNPQGDDFDRYHLRIHKDSAGFIKEWCDVVGFCCYETSAGKLDDDQRAAKGISTGERIMHLERTAAYDAKSRIPLPAELMMGLADPWEPLAAALNAAKLATPIKLRSAIKAELARLGNPEGLVAAVSADVTKYKDNPIVLHRYLNNLKSRQTEETTNV